MEEHLAVLALVVLAGFALAGVQAQDERPRRTVNVTLDDDGCPDGPDRFCAQPAEVTLEDGTDLVLRVTNEGRIEHNLTFAPGTAPTLAKHGMNGTLAVNDTQQIRIPWPDVEAGLEGSDHANLTLQCGRDGHAALGETLRLHVPSLAASDENPQPGIGAVAAVAILAGAALLRARRG